MSLYRQYRPQNFSELVGQEDLVQTLKTQLAAGKFLSAFNTSSVKAWPLEVDRLVLLVRSIFR